MDRQEVLTEIAEAALFGNLGLFVGSGFSRAAAGYMAPDFFTLLQSVAHDLKIDYAFDDVNTIKGKSLPKIADDLVTWLEENKHHDRAKAILEFKNCIAIRCNLHARVSHAMEYREILCLIPKQWVITTNYDFILEDLIEKSIAVLPDQIVNARHDFIPIYHLHGHRRNPHSIVVTESDYIRALSPLEYRQLKLTLLLAESTTIMLGYSLGDSNVQMAIDWSRRFREDTGLMYESYQGKVIQALYKTTSKNDPYKGPNDEIIIETNNVFIFLQEVGEAIKRRQERHDEDCRIIDIEWLSEETVAKLVAEDSSVRAKFISIIRHFPRCFDMQRVLNFLDKCLEPVWAKALEPLQFEHYGKFLDILLDVLEHLPPDQIHPSLLRYLAEKLATVAYVIQPEGQHFHGYSYSATDIWQARKAKIPSKTIQELKSYADQYEQLVLSNLLVP